MYLDQGFLQDLDVLPFIFCEVGQHIRDPADEQLTPRLARYARRIDLQKRAGRSMCDMLAGFTCTDEGAVAR